MDSDAPRAFVLSNGKLTTVLTGGGGGFSRFDGLALTRWAPDPLRPADGPLVYFRDLDSGEFWTTSSLPGTREPDRYELALDDGIATLRRVDGAVETTLEVCVSPLRDTEHRRITLAVAGGERRIEVTTCAELVLNDGAADAAHPAFSKLFVQTTFLESAGALLATRRPRSPDDETVSLAHLLLPVDDVPAGELTFETDRLRFIGRGRRLSAPAVLTGREALSGTTGSVLDPIVALRRTVRLRPGQAVRLLAVTAAAMSREDVEVLAHASVAGDPGGDVPGAAAERTRALRAALELPPPWEQALPDLTGMVLFGGARPHRGEARWDERRAGRLRELGITGRAPLVLAHSADPAVLAGAIALGRYWRAQGLAVDLLVLPAGDTAETARRLASAPGPRGLGRTVVAEGPELQPDAIAFYRAAARLALEETPVPARARVELGGQTPLARPATADGEPRPESVAPAAEAPGVPVEPLREFNGLGGFTADGREYVIRMPPGPGAPVLPPLPWTHVVANEAAGLIASERAATHTWSVNSRENRLTPWPNDPVTDPHGEALYLRDEEAGVFWSPAPGPVPPPAICEARWQLGAAVWQTTWLDLRQEVTAFVPRHGSLRIVRVRLRNTGDRPRRVSAFAYAHWVLGALPCVNPFLRARVDPDTGAILAVNPANGEFGGRIAYAAAVSADGATAATTDRRAFLGPDGEVGDPAALRTAERLEPTPSAAGDGCAALQVSLVIEPRGTATCAFLLGQAEDEASAVEAIARFREPAAVDRALDEVRDFWVGLTGRIRVATPSPAIDLMANAWLPYQDLCCRIWARSAYYQSGGAYGFRDQLQDAAALVYFDPALTRSQIVLHAAHQFAEGDVLHWWHPPTAKGIRTRFSDDLLWLPYVAAFYVGATGDEGVLDEDAPFLIARMLKEGEDEAFVVPGESGESASVYEHCCRALDRSLAVGRNGLPLIGTGDWNDGMNRVGREGRGESVWLGFFLYAILEAFAPFCDARGDARRADRYRLHREYLNRALNAAGWDGEWYRRAYYDDGAPLGSASGDECRIDAIAQAWAVLSGAAPADRAARALDAADHYLVREDDGLIALLAPPFDRTPHDPGYIKGYLPGVRENGGQYTHGALWVVRAAAEAGRCERAAPLLELLSPVSHTRTPEGMARYRTEPYVVAADVYGVAPHVGRGGWTWYTGSAGWMLRVAIESVLGLTLERGERLRLRPCIPAAWPGFALEYHPPAGGEGGGGGGTISIQVTRGDGPTAGTLDGRPVRVVEGAIVAPLPRDGARHELRVTLGPDAAPVYRTR